MRKLMAHFALYSIPENAFIQQFSGCGFSEFWAIEELLSYFSVVRKQMKAKSQHFPRGCLKSKVKNLYMKKTIQEKASKGQPQNSGAVYIKGSGCYSRNR